MKVVDTALSFGYGGMSAEELEFLYRLCKGCRVLELGSQYGQSSYVIAQVAEHLTCVDAWGPYDFLDERQQSAYGDWSDVERRFDKNMEGTSVTKVKCRTQYLPEEYTGFHIILIDADHSYEGVAADIRLSLERLAIGGYIVFHDYNTPTWPGVKRAVDEAGLTVVQQCGFLAVTVV